ncbi:MAG: GGDEF domain-containing protein [Burkholderiaceae bacterium]|nr:GGDEF domain-containing protein [Burkholderiaceae bacterium]
MSGNTKQTVPFAQEQLTQAITQLKQGDSHEEVLPALEAVLSQLQTLSTHDHLTGALNRRTLVARLDFELQRSLRTGHTFTFAVISVDGFAQIMEQHGQNVAKQILQVVTKESIKILRTLDSFGRIAATEFAIVMPTTWLDQSLKAIERLKVRLGEVEWETIAPNLRITFCTGLTANAPGDSSDAMLSRALQALQNAKAKGSDNIAQVEYELPPYDPSVHDK